VGSSDPVIVEQDPSWWQRLLDVVGKKGWAKLIRDRLARIKAKSEEQAASAADHTAQRVRSSTARPDIKQDRATRVMSVRLPWFPLAVHFLLAATQSLMSPI
jgi:hypothetical protein